MGAYHLASSMLQNEPIPENMSGKLQEFQHDLEALSGGKAKKLCIFCAGMWGLQLYRELTNRLVNVDFFCDNNPQKVGYVVENTWCIPLEELKRVKDETLVIVSTIAPGDIVSQLSELGVPYVTTRQQLFSKLFEVPEVKWMRSLESLEEVDYTSPGVETLVGKFRETIFDICRYYEDKTSP